MCSLSREWNKPNFVVPGNLITFRIIILQQNSLLIKNTCLYQNEVKMCMFCQANIDHAEKNCIHMCYYK